MVSNSFLGLEFDGQKKKALRGGQGFGGDWFLSFSQRSFSMILKIQIIITTTNTFQCHNRFALRGFGFIDMKNALCFAATRAFEVGKFIIERLKCYPAVRVTSNNIPDEKLNVI